MRTTFLYLKSAAFILLIISAASIRSLKAQDYVITFTGSGASSNVDSVKIENLTQDIELTLKGSETLHLMGTTGIESISVDEAGKITFYPNPMKDFTRMQFVLPISGETLITLYDISGRTISQTRNFLSAGRHTYGIQSIKEGIYLVSVSAGKYYSAGSLMSSGSQSEGTEIFHENTTAIQEKKSDSKGINTEIVMQYNTGDRLKYTAFSNNYKSVFTDIPAANSNTITFNFSDCNDGNNYNYPTVHIGTQTWMAENLKTTKYNDGSDIPNVTDGALWESLTTPGYCWFNNDVANKDIYGALYNYHAVATGKLCPDGWHVPTDDEWASLAYFLYVNGYKCDGTYGGTYAIAKSLAATTNWKASTGIGAVGNTDFPDKRNATGFTALPGSNRYSDPGGEFGGVDGTIGDYANWWSATEVPNTIKAKGRWMHRDNYGLWGYDFKRTHGFSVRCLKDL